MEGGLHGRILGLQQQAGNAAVGQLLRSWFPDPTGGGQAQPPPGDLPPGAFKPTGVAGEVKIGPNAFGRGTFVEPAAPRVVATGGTQVAVGDVEVAGTVVEEGGPVALRGASIFAGGGVAAAAGTVAVLGAVVLAGGAVIVIVLSSGLEGAPDGDAGATLPGGKGDTPVTDPSHHEPAKLPSVGEQGAASAPGAAGGGAVSEPTVVDDRVECAKKNRAKQTHDHHVFPREFRGEFEYIGIDFDKYTITLPWDKHVGKFGVHQLMFWNEEWEWFVQKIHKNMKKKERKELKQAAKEKALKMLEEMGVPLNEQSLHRFHEKPEEDDTDDE